MSTSESTWICAVRRRRAVVWRGGGSRHSHGFGYLHVQRAGGRGNVGAGLTAGFSYEDIEGGFTGTDVNIGTYGVSYGTGDDEEDYASVSVGPGAGISNNQMTTTTTLSDTLDKLRNVLRR